MGTEARARLGLIALLFVAFLSFSQVFGDGGYQGPALLGMLLAGGISVASRRLRLPAPAAVGISIAALAWYVALVFEPSATLHGLPTPAAYGNLGSDLADALRHSNVDYAPVPLRTGYVALTVIGLWLVTAAAETATFRWRRPLAASLPVLALFTFALVVGTRAIAPVYVVLFLVTLLAYWGFEWTHRLRSWGRWVPTWEHQKEEQPSSMSGITASLARKMGAGCVAAALFAPILLPGGDGIFAWRDGGNGNGPAVGAGGRIDPLVSIAPQIISQSGSVLFTVTADQASYWRLTTLGHFDGTSWTQVGGEDSGLSGDSIPASAPDEAVSAVAQTYSIKALNADYLPAAPTPTSLHFVGFDQRSQIKTNPGTGDLLFEGFVQNLDYDVTSVVSEPTYKQLSKAAVGDPGAVYIEHPKLSPEVLRLLGRWTSGSSTALAKLVAVQSHLRHFRYSLTSRQVVGGQLASTDYLTKFLTKTRRGYCQQFATAFALLGRELGYPTRVVVGFLPGTRTGGNGTRSAFQVKGTDAHAWPEVYFRGYGWVQFEPTPRADVPATPPTYTKIPKSQLAIGTGTQVGGPTGGKNGAGGPGGAAGAGQRKNISAAFEGRLSAGRKSGTRSQPSAGAPQWQAAFARLAIGLGALALLVLVVIPLLKLGRARRRYAHASGPRDKTVAAFMDFQDEATDMISPRGHSESAPVYVRRVTERRRVPGRDALRLATLYEVAEYGPGGVGEDIATEARRLAGTLKSGLWRSASWWERVLRLFSPRGLTRS